MILVNSFGGCATTMLIEQISAAGRPLVFDGTNGPFKKYKHIPFPTQSKLSESGIEIEVTKALYVYSDPIEAVKTFYRRREVGNDGTGMIADWVTGHCRNMMGDHEALKPSWNIDDYAQNRKDLIGMNSHWIQWNNNPVQYDVMFVKYEKMWENLDVIREFLDLPESFVNSFPPKRKREKFHVQKETDLALEELYGALRLEIERQPGIRVRKCLS